MENLRIQHYKLFEANTNIQRNIEMHYSSSKFDILQSRKFPNQLFLSCYHFGFNVDYTLQERISFSFFDTNTLQKIQKHIFHVLSVLRRILQLSYSIEPIMTTKYFDYQDYQDLTTKYNCNNSPKPAPCP